MTARKNVVVSMVKAMPTENLIATAEEVVTEVVERCGFGFAYHLGRGEPRAKLLALAEVAEAAHADGVESTRAEVMAELKKIRSGKAVTP